MPNPTPNPSLLAAWETALNARCAELLNFPFNYPVLRTTVQHSPRGFAVCDRYTPRTASNSLQSLLSVQVRLVLCTSGDAIEGYRLLKDWAIDLRDALALIGDEGISGNYRGIAISRAWSGLRATEPFQFVVEDQTQVQSSSDDYFHGLILARYQAFMSEDEFGF